MADTTVKVGSETVHLRPSITVPMGIAAMYAIQSGVANGADEADLRGALAQVYLHHAIESWTFTEGLEPVPVTPANVDRLLPFHRGGMEVAAAADNLYSADLLLAFPKAPSTRSPDGPMDGLTSASPATGPKHQKHSRPSSPNGTAGKPSEALVP